jgi:hypothetical protein
MPDPHTLAALVSIPSATAVISTVVIFLKFITTQRAEDRKERAADRLVWENHLSSTVRSLQQINDNLTELRNDARTK